MEAKHGLALPKAYLSYSALMLWKRDKRGFRRKYYEGQDSPSTPYTIFGKVIAEKLENKSELIHIPRYEVSELECRTKIDGVPVLGYLDSFDPNEHRILEFKTGIRTPSGKPRWTNLEVHKHEQLPFYSMLVEDIYGSVNPTVTLTWLETAWVEHDVMFFADELDMELFATETSLELTGHYESFTRVIEPWERERMREWVRTASREISEDYSAYKAARKLSTPSL